MTFVDTNYFLRFLLADVSSQRLLAKSLFQDAAEGKALLFTSSIVIFEIYWVLISVYGKDREQIAIVLNNLLDMSFIDFEHYSLLKRSIPLYKSTSLGLVDVFNLLYAKSAGAKNFKTFDLKLSKKFISL
ncbi:PIN domain-containing protein [Candidatus Amesbacteria bacterium]|nr:PIN domain-containing protein [Candidatus Amesbacteria bacterium]